MKQFSFFSLSPILLIGLFFFAQTQFAPPELEKRTEYVAPPLVLKHLTGGFNVQFSDSFWMRAIYDFDYCDQLTNTSECKGGSWLYRVVDLVTELDIKFLQSYYYGALALTVIISDYDGASKIFDKGVEQFPTDWLLTYAAGYHALYEEKNKLKASRLYLLAADHGAPAWVRLLSGKLASDGGDNEFASQILDQLIKGNVDPRWVERLKQKMRETKEEAK